jgi:serine protease Do
MEKYSTNSPIPKIVKKVLPAVVSITVSKMLPVFENPFGGSPYENEGFLMVPKGKKKIQIGGGSGFIVDSSGIILTNRHVVTDPDAEYIAVLDDERKCPAHVLARDPFNDVAILKITEKNLPIIELGDSTGLELGQTAIAIGNVLGNFRNTVSVGVVSGLSREITAGDATTQTMTKLRGLIQTDAAINPGNSGGPLIDMNGKAIGINTAMVFMAENVGFALPINNARRDLENLKKHGKLRHAFLGIRYIMLDDELKERFGLPINEGALVVSEPTPQGKAVVPGGAADKAGLREGDVILEIRDQKITSKIPPEEILQRSQIGEAVAVKVLRHGKELGLRVKLGERN